MPMRFKRTRMGEMQYTRASRRFVVYWVALPSQMLPFAKSVLRVCDVFQLTSRHPVKARARPHSLDRYSSFATVMSLSLDICGMGVVERVWSKSQFALIILFRARVTTSLVQQVFLRA
ncbi:unnamed protein product [Ectocarpus sp. 8 AP-2014]